MVKLGVVEVLDYSSEPDGRLANVKKVCPLLCVTSTHSSIVCSKLIF